MYPARPEHRDHGIDVGFAYDRKEAKDHGEGGRVVGAPLKGKRVLVLDDVMTSGKAVRISVDAIHAEGGDVVGAVLLLDREEVGPGGKSATQEVSAQLGGGPCVHTIVRMRDLMVWLKENGKTDELAQMQAYWEQYGVKE